LARGTAHVRDWRAVMTGFEADARRSGEAGERAYQLFGEGSAPASTDPLAADRGSACAGVVNESDADSTESERRWRRHTGRRLRRLVRRSRPLAANLEETGRRLAAGADEAALGELNRELHVRAATLGEGEDRVRAQSRAGVARARASDAAAGSGS
jgi:hypothetical protein